jgi:hypothetical protein
MSTDYHKMLKIKINDFRTVTDIKYQFFIQWNGFVISKNDLFQLLFIPRITIKG